MINDNEVSQVELVQSEKDLGVITDSSLKFSEHINSKIKIANRNLRLMFRSVSYMDKDMFLSFYKSIVRPHLKYASCTWAPVYKRDYCIRKCPEKSYKDGTMSQGFAIQRKAQENWFTLVGISPTKSRRYPSIQNFT